jgi:hypothetical protein
MFFVQALPWAERAVVVEDDEDVDEQDGLFAQLRMEADLWTRYHLALEGASARMVVGLVGVGGACVPWLCVLPIPGWPTPPLGEMTDDPSCPAVHFALSLRVRPPSTCCVRCMMHICFILRGNCAA